MESLEDKMENVPEPEIFKRYFAFLEWKWGRLLIVTWWFAMIVLGIFYGFDLLNLTNFEFDPPSGSKADKAQNEFNDQFHSIASTKELVVYYKCTKAKCNTSYPITRQSLNMQNMSIALNASLHTYSEDHDNIIKSYKDIYNAIPICTRYSSLDKCMTYLDETYVSADGDSAMGVIRYDGGATTSETKNMNNYIKKKCEEISASNGDRIVIKFTGETPMIQDMTAASRDDVEKKDIITIPIALCVLAFVVRTWRTMFIPIICVFGSVCTSFSIMRPVAEYGFNVNPFAPSIMMSVTVAMSIDYSLFLLTRFREEIEKQLKHGRTIADLDVTAAIRQVVRWSGKVVAFSGFILSITYVGLVFYPMTMLQSVGLGASIAVMCTILINLTCTPALLLMFPDFFKVLGCQLPLALQRVLTRLGIKLPSQSSKYDKFLDETDGHFEGPERNLMAQASINAPLNQPVDASHSLNIRTEDEVSAYRKKPAADDIHPFAITDEERANLCNRCWYECGSYSTLWPYSLIIIFVVYALISPVGWRIVELRKQLEDTLIFPRNSEYLETYEEVKTDFSAGALAPWYVIIPDPNYSPSNASRNVRSWTYIHDTGVIMTNLFYQLGISNYNMTTSIGISAFKDKTFADEDAYSKARNSTLYNQFTRNYISDDNSTSYFQMISSFDPYYSNAIDFVSHCRDVMDNLCEHGAPSGASYKCYLTGGSVNEVDLVNTIFSQFPFVLLGIVLAVFCIMGACFASAFVPIRLFITIAVPLTLVYGLSILVYQRGLLSGLNWSALANTHGLYWLAPVMTVTILIGLALDYDVFLFARVYEYRLLGLPTRESIVRGIYNTGSIITAAGVIMAIAFCGLLFSEITSLNQTGFILVVAVLVDTFIIRTLLVPAVLSLAKEVNWWPGLKDNGTASGSNTSNKQHFHSPSNEPLQPL